MKDDISIKQNYNIIIEKKEIIVQVDISQAAVGTVASRLLKLTQ